MNRKIFHIFILLSVNAFIATCDDSLIISSNNLYDLINQVDFDKNYRLIETNFGSDGQVEYSKAHIPKSIYIDVTYNSTSTQYIKYNIPEAKTFASYLGSLGISNQHKIIIYDRSDFGFLASSRLWYLLELYGNFKISVLNGGLNDWIANKFPLTSDTPRYQTQSYSAVFQPSLLRLYEEVLYNVTTRLEDFVDARNKDKYDQAHIPTAFSVPYDDLFDPISGLLKTKSEILDMVAKHGVDLNRPLVTYCQTGVSASTLKLVLNLIGAKNVALYNGSWYEYSQRSKRNSLLRKFIKRQD